GGGGNYTKRPTATRFHLIPLQVYPPAQKEKRTTLIYMFAGSSEVDLVCIMPLKKYKSVGWGEAGTPTITPGVDLCWGSYLTPTYD
ncbi:MAG TPA: hypothetical protein VIQ81_04610, partial [Gammaproteobacteria bacterium]